jgi:hypothetical protein
LHPRPWKLLIHPGWLQPEMLPASGTGSCLIPGNGAPGQPVVQRNLFRPKEGSALGMHLCGPRTFHLLAPGHGIIYAFPSSWSQEAQPQPQTTRGCGRDRERPGPLTTSAITTEGKGLPCHVRQSNCAGPPPVLQPHCGAPFLRCSSSDSRSSRVCACRAPTRCAVSVAVMSIWA